MVKRIVCPNCSYVQELNSTDNDSLRVCPSCQHKWLSMQNSAYQNRKNIKVITKTANHYKYTLSKYKDKNSTYPFFVMDNNYVEFSAPRKVRQFKQSDLIGTKLKPQININRELQDTISTKENSVTNEENTLLWHEVEPKSNTNLTESIRNERVNEKKENLNKPQVIKEGNVLQKPIKEQVSTLDKIKAFFGFRKKELLPSLNLAEASEKLNGSQYKALDKIATQELGTLTKFYNQESDGKYKIPKLTIPDKKTRFNDEDINDKDVFSLKHRHNTSFKENIEAEVEKRQIALRRAKERELQKLPHNNINIRGASANRGLTSDLIVGKRIPLTIVDPLVTNKGNNFLEQMEQKQESKISINETNYKDPQERLRSHKENTKIINADDLSSPLNNKDLVNIVAKERIIYNNKESKIQQLSLINNNKLINETKYKDSDSNVSLGRESNLSNTLKEIDIEGKTLPSVPKTHITTEPIRIKRSLSDSHQDTNLSEMNRERVGGINQDVAFVQDIKDSKALRSRNQMFATSNNKNNAILSLQEQTFAGKFLQEEDESTQSIIPNEAKGFFYEEDDSNILNNNLNIDKDMRTFERNSPQAQKLKATKLKALDTLNERENKKSPSKELLHQQRNSLKAVGVSRDRQDLIFTNNEDGGVFYEEFLEEDKEKLDSIKRSSPEESLARQEKRKILLDKRQERTTRIRDNISKQDTNNNDSKGSAIGDSRIRSEHRAVRHADKQDVSSPHIDIDSLDSKESPVKNANIDNANINFNSNEYKESRPFNLQAKMQEFSKEEARQNQDSLNSPSNQGVSLTDLMSADPYNSKDSTENLVTDHQQLDSYSATGKQDNSITDKNTKIAMDNKASVEKPSANQKLANSIGKESIGQQKLNEPILPKDLTSSLQKNNDTDLDLPNIQGDERERFSDSIPNPQDLKNEPLVPTENQQFSAKEFLLQKIAEGDKEYLDFLNNKIDTLKSEDIKQALIHKTQEISKQEQQQSLHKEEKLLGANNYTSTDLAKDMKKKMSGLKTPKGYVVLVIIAILVLTLFYFFSASYMSLKKGDQLKKQTVDGIPAIDDKEVADYTVPNGKQNGIKGATLGSEGDNKVAIEVSKDKKNPLEVLKVDREKLDSKKSLEQDLQNRIAQENDDSQGSAIGAKLSKSILQTKQSMANLFNSVKVYKVNSFWETSNHSPQFKTVVTLYNSSTSQSYKVKEMELVFVNANGKKISTRKITPNKVIRSGEFVRINIIFHETSKITANAYVFVKQAVAQ